MRKYLITTPYMGIELYKIISYPTLDYKTKIEDSFYTIDSHNHSEGKGKNVTPAGLDINSDLSLNGNGFFSLGGVDITPVSSCSTVMSLYFKGNDLYTRDGLGTEIRLTEGGSFLTGSENIIGGDYSTSNAEIVYDSTEGVYYCTNEVGSNAKINIHDLILNNTGGNTLTLSLSDLAGSSYSLNFGSDIYEYDGVVKIDMSGNITSEQYTVSDNSRDLLFKVGDEYTATPLKLSYFPTGDPFKALTISASLGVEEVSTSSLKIPEIDTSVPSVIGMFGVEGGAIKLYTNTWNTMYTQTLPSLSFSNILDTSISLPQIGEYILYNTDSTTFTNGVYPPPSYDDLVSKPTDITDLSVESVQSLSDVSPLGWGNVSSESRILKYNSNNELVLSPDGGDIGLWGDISGDISTNIPINTAANNYLNRFNVVDFLDTSDDLFTLPDVVDSPDLSYSTSNYVLRWRRDEPESETNFEGSFQLEEYITASITEPTFEQKGQLFSYDAPLASEVASPTTGNLVDYTNYPATDSCLTVVANINNVLVLKHTPIDELNNAPAGYIKSFTLKEASAGESQIVTFPTLPTRAYKVKITNIKGSTDVIFRFGSLSVGCKPGDIEYFVLESGVTGYNITVRTALGFEGIAIVTIFPYELI